MQVKNCGVNTIVSLFKTCTISGHISKKNFNSCEKEEKKMNRQLFLKMIDSHSLVN